MKFLSAALVLVFSGVILAAAAPVRAEGQTLTPEEAEKAIAKVEDLLRGRATVGEMEMYIHRWKRTMAMKFWENVPDKSLVKVISPAEDAGMGTLKINHDMWTYNPKIDQVQKIPPSLMLESWMGSDMSNDDVARSSSIKDDYIVGAGVAGELDGVKTWRLTLTPRPESPIVWDNLVLEVAQDDFRPLRQDYYDEKGRLARQMHFKDYRKLDDGRNYPFIWRMDNMIDQGRYTEIRVKSMEFKDKLPDGMFSIRALKKARR